MKKLYIGNQTAFFTPDAEEPFKFAVDSGFNAFEWFDDKKDYPDGTGSGWTLEDMSPQRRQQLAALALSGRIRYSVHARWQANPHKDNGIASIIEAINFAAEISAPIVVIHFYPEVEEYARKIIPALKVAAEAGVRLAIENTPLNTADEFNRLFALLKTSEYADSFGMCLDIGHANCAKATKNDFIRFIDELSSEVNIIHCHVHENWGDQDSHLPLFTGPSKDNDLGIRLFVRRLIGRGFDGSLIMEQFPEPRELLVTIKSRLCAIFSEESDCAYEYLEGGITAEEIVEVEDAVLLKNADSGCLVQSKNALSDSLDAASEAEISEDDAADYFEPLAIDELDNPYALELVEASQKNTSWRTRLEWILDSLIADTFQPSLENLSVIAVYLRFMATGELQCAEDGGHYRPCHHSRAAQDIQQRLNALQTPQNRWLLRRILPWLPSCDEQFQRSEPLTRIRDIAHRNDIPRELKLHIKHDLQNKLHRSAGPEDLKTSSEILTQITAEGADYSPAFVEQFTIFHQELLEFFNAPELPARLDRIQSVLPDLSDACSDFLRSYSSADPLKKAQTALLLRTVLHGYSATDDLSTMQALRVADIELEDFSFSSLSTVVSGFEGSTSILPGWFSALLAALGHISLSGVDCEESKIIISEIEKWREGFAGNGRFELLRLRATLERTRRLCDRYMALVTDVFAPVVSALGAALGVAPRACAVFIEGDIRGNMVFLLSRLCSAGLKVIRRELVLPPWDVLVSGRRSGVLQYARSIEEFEGVEGQFIALVKSADGEEELPSCLKGVLLAHPLPHLSHLAVRARQAGIIFAACDEIDSFETLRERDGETVSFDFGAGGITFIDNTEILSGDGPGDTGSVVKALDIEIDGRAIIPVAQASPVNAGAKSNGARELIDMALASGGLFSAPKSQVIPFGVMEQSLAANDSVFAEYNKIVAGLNDAEGKEFDIALRSLRKIINSLEFKEVSEVEKYFGSDCYTAVRSSSNGEDLQNLAGAGLYDSVIGVPAPEVAGAVSTVWASLWTHRAAMSRKQYSISHAAIKMAVLIQEVIEPEFSFVMHTADPVSGERGCIGIEISRGLGETLVSAHQPGQPYRLSVCNDEVTLQSMASFSDELYLSLNDGVVPRMIDYSKCQLSLLWSELSALALKIAACGRFIDDHFGAAQDIEGVVRNGVVWIVQTRPQCGVIVEEV